MRIGISDDYATAYDDEWEFYYGYEYKYEFAPDSEDSVYGFYAKHNGTLMLNYETSEPHQEMVKGLIEGMARMIQSAPQAQEE